MIKVTFQTPDGVYWAVCEKLRYFRGSGYFMECVVEDSSSSGRAQWVKTAENWMLMTAEEV